MAKKNDRRGANESTLMPGRDAGADVLEAVGERVAELEVGRRPGLLHVIAGDRDRVELRHPLRREREDVRDDLHRGCGRIDVRVPHHELFEDVVLDRARELLGRDPLLLGGDDVEREDRAGPRRSSSSTRSSCRAGCRRRGGACRGWSRWRRRPSRRRRGRAGGRCRSRGGSRDRRRSRAPSARRRGCGGRTRSSLPPSRSRRTAGRSTAAARTSSGRARGRTARSPGTYRGARRPRDRLRRRARGAGSLRACPRSRRASAKAGPARAPTMASKSEQREVGQVGRVIEMTSRSSERSGDGVAAGVEEAVDAGFPERGLERARGVRRAGPCGTPRPSALARWSTASAA